MTEKLVTYVYHSSPFKFLLGVLLLMQNSKYKGQRIRVTTFFEFTERGRVVKGVKKLYSFSLCFEDYQTFSFVEVFNECSSPKMLS